MTRWRAVVWVPLLAAVVVAAELLERVHVPAPQMVLAIVVGALLAMTGRLPAPLPERVSTATHAMMGVLMGSYLQLSLLTSLGGALLPVLAITLMTPVIGVLVSIGYARVAKVGLPTSFLGLLAGGSAAVIVVADEVDADARQVAFMQYLRVALVAISAPVVVALLGGEKPVDTGSAELFGIGTDQGLPWWTIVAREDQAAGLSIAVVLGFVGLAVGRKLRLPSPDLIGPMLAAAVFTAVGFTRDYAPTNLFQELLFVLIGFEVGTRFTRPVVAAMARMIPAMIAAIATLSAAVGALAVGVAALVGLEPSDVYLATTPGGINAVLAVAGDMNADMALITTVQSVRLILVMLSLPLLLRLLRRLSAREAAPRPHVTVGG
ncbi:AbrB family transcriptional regulator [Nocardia sp. NPDC049149]|uniref:AbrB family transcriptional regulator n=1 Tax=Nocardia sp. NPDC049149 TaxID=3364315 RepID=UPI0037196BC8